MIIGTAGHIDHGKTSLVRALTGVDTDRLKEEKARGISIELGYAYLPLASGGVLGFIDVPGHEKLIHTMAAGASGIDFGLLVIAADDGVMPQTREHLSILRFLGVRRGAIAVTKVDRVTPERLEKVHVEIAALLADTTLADARLFDTNSTEALDPGLAALNAYLQDVALQGPERSESEDALFRLAVDRVFTLEGKGTVVTGTVVAGSVSVGDTMLLAPSFMPVRVRSVHAQNRPVQTGHAGERCALNLANIEKSAISRGDWIVDPALDRDTVRLDATLELLRDVDTDLRHWSTVHFHLGTQHRVAHVVLLDGMLTGGGETGQWKAGIRGRVQLVFEQPICALPGDRFIVRNAQASRTIGGGQVVDPFAPARNRRTPRRIAWLDALQDMLTTGSTRALLDAAPEGLPRSLYMHLSGAPFVSSHVPDDTHLVRLSGGDAWIIADTPWRVWSARLKEALGRFHASFPDELGADVSRLRRMTAPAMHTALWQALVDDASSQGMLIKTGPWLHLPEHAVTLDARERAVADVLLPIIKGKRFDPPWVRDLAVENRFSEDDVRRVMRKLARSGDVFAVVRDLFYHHASIVELAKVAKDLADSDRGVIATALFRDATALGRKRAIQILEFFDRAGYTRFHREVRMLREDTHWLGL